MPLLKFPLPLGTFSILCDYWKKFELAAALCANCCIILATIDYERRYSHRRDERNCRENDSSEELRWACLVLTMISVVGLLLRDVGKKLFYLREGFVGAQWLHSSTMCEIAMLMVFPYPRVKGEFRFMQSFRVVGEVVYMSAELCYTTAEIVYIAMFLRLIFLVRVICRFSVYESDISLRVGRRYRVWPGFWFSLQCFYYQYPFTIISSLFTLQILLLAVLLRVLERPFAEVSGMGLDSYGNVLWMLAATTTTIGYGDFYPTTRYGRIVCGSVALLGSVLVVASITALLKNLDLTVPEMRCYRRIYEQRRAGKLVSLALKFNLSKKKHPMRSLVSWMLIKSYVKHHRTVEMQNFCRHEEEREKLRDMIIKLSRGIKMLHKKLDNAIHSTYKES